MAAAPYNATGEYQPESIISLPALYVWPPKPLAPMDALFGSWHDGSKESLQAQKERKRQNRRQAV